jgi:hypothetical protein
MIAMTARKSGRCARTGKTIKPGDAILWSPRTKRATLAGVDTIGIGGKTYYRNRAGRCEDAPCCGCCTI